MNDITKVVKPPVAGAQTPQYASVKPKTEVESSSEKPVKKNESEKHRTQPQKIDTLWQNLTEEELKKVTEWLNDSMRLFNFRLQFEIRQHPNHIVAKVLDKETGEVIREVPPESLSSMINRMRSEMGVFVDEII